MIHIDNVSLQLNKRQILSNISLDLHPGKIYGLVGNNGCGKTMLMKCICGFVHPTGGQIQDKIIVIASHNAEDIEVLCDRVYEMDNGTLKQNRRRTCLKMNGKDRK